MLRIDAVPLYMEGIGDGLPQSSQGPHHCQDDAHDWRNRVSRYPAAGEVVMEPEKVAPYFGTVGKAGMSYALQCDHHGGHLEHGSHKGCKALKSQMETVSSCPLPVPSSTICGVTMI